VLNFGIVDYAAGNQNWSISQSDDRTMYFGNNYGLLEYNGSSWGMYPSPNGTIIRAVKVIDDLIYTGCYMEMGYWKRNAIGDLEYFSLLDKLETPLIEDEHFWNITAHDEWVLFQSLDRIYLYNAAQENFKVIDFHTNRAKIFNLGNKIYVQKTSSGIYSIQNGEAVLVAEQEILRNKVVVGIYSHKGRLLLITEDGKFYFLDEGNLVAWPQDDLAGIDELNVYSSLQLRDGSFVLGTISNGYIRIDHEGRLLEMIDQERGLINNTVLSAFEDADNNLWLGLDNGISAINLESSFRIYSDTKGKLGVVYASLVFEDRLYLGTNQGLFSRSANKEEPFHLIRGTNGQVWSLKVIDQTLFCGHTNGTFVVQGTDADLISDFSGTWEVHPLPERDDLLIQGNYNGLSILSKESGQWKLKRQLQGFDISSKSMALLNGGGMLVNHEFKGIFHLQINDDYSGLKLLKELPPAGYDSSISRFGDRILYSSNVGVFQIDPETITFQPDTLLSNTFYDPEDRMNGKLIVDEQENKVWGFSQRNIICLAPDIFDGTPRISRIAIPSFFRTNQGLVGFENVSALGEERFLIGTAGGYVVLDLGKEREKTYRIDIHTIQKQFQNTERAKVSLVDGQSFLYKENNLTFSYGVPEFDKYTEVAYQYQLKGLYDEWSKWSNEPYVSFGNLPHGKYNFMVRARIGNSFSENTASYSFTIGKPWYLSTRSIIGYALGTLLLMLLVHRSYWRHYTKQKNKLIEENRKSMELAQLESEQEIMKLKNEQLKQDIEGKNRELAITTMSLINKNELLQGIKNDLSHLEDKTTRGQVIRVINKNLNNDHDWAYFQEAFNNADKDFLKKVHKKHPNLTPNDLKLCAYLRLNLSSKEIAPLLNISVRSVEIKRYRLRKKINLDHEKSLVDYILSI